MCWVASERFRRGSLLGFPRYVCGSRAWEGGDPEPRNPKPYLEVHG